MRRICTLLAILVSLSVSAQQEFLNSSKTVHQILSGSIKNCSTISCPCTKGQYTYQSYNANDNPLQLDIKETDLLIPEADIVYDSDAPHHNLPSSPSYKFYNITFLGFSIVERLA